MKWTVRRQYILYIVVLHAVLLFLMYRLLAADKVYFIASEVFLLISVIVSIILFRSFMQPNAFVRSGIEAIKDKDFTVKFVPTGKGEVDALIEVYNLMIDQLRQERTRLFEQHFFLEKLIAASPISIIILDFDNRVEQLNHKAQQQFGAEAGMLVGKFLSESNVPLLQQLDQIPNGESRIIRQNGMETFKAQRSNFIDQGFSRSFLMIEELTTELLESEKIAYGKVIRMMAHEVNNTLGATDSILQSAIEFFPDHDPFDIKDALRVASERNRRLGRFMRNFADVVRLPNPQLKEVDLTTLIRDIVHFMQPLAEARKIHIEIEKQVPLRRMADAAQLEQVLVNILKNALESCQPEQQVLIELNAKQICIRNNGKPILPDEAAHLFQPFYSTKPHGQGIGLTLSREILHKHGFTFLLQTGADGWTQFTINL
ncbi:sensor histidine kinase [Arundinibacter roseus]|uniref:histidine kinase n=1 Tax=Arundinibacter roseus TaxID=2070510 RepID=A0A4R4KGY6_9BACT|nr:ATP-binding protein [Arundinibacter roseus]TDB67307.1 histidine kinase [Arundinibacter roseus]